MATGLDHLATLNLPQNVTRSPPSSHLSAAQASTTNEGRDEAGRTNQASVGREGHGEIDDIDRAVYLRLSPPQQPREYEDSSTLAWDSGEYEIDERLFKSTIVKLPL